MTENSMLLTLDVGNSNTVLGLYRLNSDELVTSWRISTLRAQTVDEYGVLLLNLFSMRKIEATEVSSIIISSVVPPLDSTLRQVCERYFNLKAMFVEPGIKTGMPILVDNPAELGADRLVNCVAAFARYGGPCIVVDFGTATTFDVVAQPAWGVSGRRHCSRPGHLGRCALLARCAAAESRHPQAGQGHWHRHRGQPTDRPLLRLHRAGGRNSGTEVDRGAWPGDTHHRHWRPGAADRGRLQIPSTRWTSC